MKTKFSNAEKVSDGFLKLIYEEISNRFSNFKKIDFVYKSFIEKLEVVIRSEADNYEKLKAMLGVEKEFEAYISSKDYLLEVIRYIISWLTDYNRHIQKSTYTSKKVIIIGEDETFPSDSKEIFFISLICGDNKAEAYQVLNEMFLPGEKYISFVSTAKMLQEEDHNQIMAEIKRNYKKLFMEAFRHHDLIKFDGLVLSDALEHRLFKIAMEAYWEVFNYNDQDKLANKFKDYIISVTSEDIRAINLISNLKFWKLLVGFDEFYSKNKGEIVSAEKSFENDVIPTATPKITLRKVKSVDEIVGTKILYNMDLTGLSDISGIDFEGYTIFNCNFNGTNAVIDLTKINQETSLCYIRGKKVDRLDLSTSCFKGCRIREITFENINQYSFSRDTFDKKVLTKAGFALEGIDKRIAEKYYRKIWPNVVEFGVLLSKFNKAIIFERYKDIENHSEFAWLLLFEEVFPENNVFISL